MKHRAVAIIPARGGSKRILGKNIVNIGKMPLIAYSILSAKKSGLFSDDVFVSTDDDAISRVSAKYGAQVLKRPKKLSGDKIETLDVLKHVIYQLEKSLDFDTVVLLQPTSPFRKVETIKAGVKKLWNNWGTMDAIFSVTLSKFPPNWLLKTNGQRLEFILANNFSKIRTQDISETYEIDGVLYVYKKISLKKTKRYAFFENRTGYIRTKKIESLDIDDFEDLKIARALA